MKNLVKALVALIVIIPLSGCALLPMVADISGDACELIIGGSKIDPLCVKLEEVISPEKEVAEEIN